jgi:hypothetical protein
MVHNKIILVRHVNPHYKRSQSMCPTAFQPTHASNAHNSLAERQGKCGNLEESGIPYGRFAGYYGRLEPSEYDV